MANLNPIASGNKTVSGSTGVILVFVVSTLLKKYGIVDESGLITAELVGYITMGGLAVWGVIHKIIKRMLRK